MSELPETYERMKRQYPELTDRYEALGLAAKDAGPLDAPTAALVKLALCFGAGLEGAAHSSVRKALAAGCTPQQLHHMALLGIPTLGWPAMVRANSWVDDIVNK